MVLWSRTGAVGALLHVASAVVCFAARREFQRRGVLRDFVHAT